MVRANLGNRLTIGWVAVRKGLSEGRGGQCQKWQESAEGETHDAVLIVIVPTPKMQRSIVHRCNRQVVRASAS